MISLKAECPESKTCLKVSLFALLGELTHSRNVRLCMWTRRLHISKAAVAEHVSNSYDRPKEHSKKKKVPKLEQLLVRLVTLPP